MNYIIEIATTDFESTQAAVKGGADRIELCANLGEGGTTQSYGVIKKCRELFNTQLYPIIRVRGGDFLYTDEEFQCMKLDALMCKELACDGVVVGFLKDNGNIDVKRTAEIVEAVYPLGVTFHRAFDRCKDPFEALEQLIEIGCTRILTSGQQKTVPEGAEFIKKLQTAAADKIIIMPGSGVRTNNVKELAEITGCTEFHSSLRTIVETEMNFITPAFAGDKENHHYSVIASDVKAFKEALMG